MDAARLERLWREVGEVRDRVSPDEEIRLTDLLLLPGVISIDELGRKMAAVEARHEAERARGAKS